MWEQITVPVVSRCHRATSKNHAIVHEIMSQYYYKHNFIKPSPIDQLVVKYSAAFHTKTNDGILACPDVTTD